MERQKSFSERPSSEMGERWSPRIRFRPHPPSTRKNRQGSESPGDEPFRLGRQKSAEMQAASEITGRLTEALRAFEVDEDRRLSEEQDGVELTSFKDGLERLVVEHGKHAKSSNSLLSEVIQHMDEMSHIAPAELTPEHKALSRLLDEANVGLVAVNEMKSASSKLQFLYQREQKHVREMEFKIEELGTEVGRERALRAKEVAAAEEEVRRNKTEVERIKNQKMQAD